MPTDHPTAVLKACPFCGAPAGEVIHHIHPQRLADGTIYERRSVRCSKDSQGCNGQGRIEDSEAAAIAAWNQRKEASHE